MMNTENNLLKHLHVKRITKNQDWSTLVFLHDSLGCVELWRDFPERLSENLKMNLLIYDRQGYGKSCSFTYSQRSVNYMEDEADILINLLNQLELNKVFLFGHSDGATIALIAAGKYSQRIAGVVSEAGHIFVEEITLNGIRDAVTAYQKTSLKEKLQKYHADKTEAVFQMWTQTWLRPDFKDWTVLHFLHEIICPVLLIQGEQDEYGSLAQVDGVEQRMQATAEKLIIPNVKHTPHKEVPEIVIHKSAVFLNKILKSNLQSHDK